MKAKNRFPKSVPHKTEYCANPWNGKCKNTDVTLYIFYEGHRVPICRSCWNNIADNNLEWGDRRVY